MPRPLIWGESLSSASQGDIPESSFLSIAPNPKAATTTVLLQRGFWGGSPRKWKVWRQHTDLPEICRVPWTQAASSLPGSSTASMLGQLCWAVDGWFCKLTGNCCFFLACSYLQFSMSPCPSLAEYLLRCMFLNCESICLTPGARGSMIYFAGFQATVVNVLLQTGKLQQL